MIYVPTLSMWFKIFTHGNNLWYYYFVDIQAVQNEPCLSLSYGFEIFGLLTAKLNERVYTEWEELDMLVSMNFVGGKVSEGIFLCVSSSINVSWEKAVSGSKVEKKACEAVSQQTYIVFFIIITYLLQH